MTCLHEAYFHLVSFLFWFNGHIWTAPALLFVFAIPIYRKAFLSLKKDVGYAFDACKTEYPPDDSRGTFKDHYDRYSDLAKLLVTLSGAVIAFMINLLAGEKRNSFVNKLDPSGHVIIGFFGSAMALLVAFMGCMAYWYEEYCHDQNFNSYKRAKYAFVITSGVLGLIAFVLGIIWLSAILF